MKKTIQISIAVIFLLTTTTFPVLAKAQAVMIPSGFVAGEHFNVVRGESYPVLGSSFYAASRMLVAEFIECVDFTVTILDQDGNVVLKLTPEVVRKLWSEPSAELSGYLYHSTHLFRSSYSRAAWSADLPDLPVGDYEVHTQLKFDHALTSGCDHDGDGKAEIYLPQDYNKEYVVYIHLTGNGWSGSTYPARQF